MQVSNAFLFQAIGGDVTPLALVVLNSDGAIASLQQLWQRASFKVVADGGANRVYNAAMAADASGKLARLLVPDVIAGDWDSVDPSVAEFYREAGCLLHKDEGQDDNDLWKSLTVIEREQEKRKVKMRVVIYGAFGGRLDQEIQNLNSLYVWDGRFDRLVIMSSQSLACLLPADTSTLTIASQWEGPTCGLLPLGCPVASLTTRGLKWDVTDWPTRFGGNISTSNHVVGCEGSTDTSKVVVVTSSEPIVWTATVTWPKA